jgi:broad specificity phosphatase PhoE
VVSSPMLRARETAKLLAPGREIVESELLREVEMIVPAVGGLRLPFAIWGPLIGFRWAYGRWRSEPACAPDCERAEAAAAWLAGVAEERGPVLAVTHGAMRRLIADALLASGWACAYPKKGRWSTWSAWELTGRSLTGGSSLPAAGPSR